MFTVRMDSRPTRRLRVHNVFNEHGARVAAHQNVGDVFQWLIDHDIRQAAFEDDKRRILVEFEPYPW